MTRALDPSRLRELCCLAHPLPLLYPPFWGSCPFSCPSNPGFVSFFLFFVATALQPKKEVEEAHAEAVELAAKYEEYESALMALDDAAKKWAVYEPYLKVCGLHAVWAGRPCLQLQCVIRAFPLRLSRRTPASVRGVSMSAWWRTCRCSRRPGLPLSISR